MSKSYGNIWGDVSGHTMTYIEESYSNVNDVGCDTYNIFYTDSYFAKCGTILFKGSLPLRQWRGWTGCTIFTILYVCVARNERRTFPLHFLLTVRRNARCDETWPTTSAFVSLKTRNDVFLRLFLVVDKKQGKKLFYSVTRHCSNLIFLFSICAT